MKRTPQTGFLVLALLAGSVASAQTASPGLTAKALSDQKESWSFSLVTQGYIFQDEDGYAQPTFTADRGWTHLEARYNSEDRRTGSLWMGYNFSAGKKLVFDITPMIGGVFGRTNGIAPGCEASLTYKKLQLSISNEYVFDTTAKSGNFYYAWPEVTYSLLDWLTVGAVAQHTKAFETRADLLRGFLVGVSHKKVEFTTYVFSAGTSTPPSVVLELGYSF
jgi:hypothetical protein